MIIGITGAICAGKRSFAEYLAAKHGFEIINLLEEFQNYLEENGQKIDHSASPLKQTPNRKLESGSSSKTPHDEECIENYEDV
jgi:dephospho-CoA kinase